MCVVIKRKQTKRKRNEINCVWLHRQSRTTLMWNLKQNSVVIVYIRTVRNLQFLNIQDNKIRQSIWNIKKNPNTKVEQNGLFLFYFSSKILRIRCYNIGGVTNVEAKSCFTFDRPENLTVPFIPNVSHKLTLSFIIYLACMRGKWEKRNEKK